MPWSSGYWQFLSTPDNQQTLQLLVDEHTISQIADQLYASDHIVRHSVERMRTKVRATPNKEAVTKAQRQGVIV